MKIGKYRTARPLLLAACLLAGSGIQAAEPPAGTTGSDGSPAPATGDGSTAPSKADLQAVTASDGSAGALRLSLNEAIQLVMKHNLEVRIRTYDDEIAQAGVLAARGAFDPVLSLNAPGFGRDRQPQALSSGVLTTAEGQTLDGDLTLSQRLPWGTTFSLEGDLSSLEWPGSSSLAADNPQFSSSLGLSFTQPLLRDLGQNLPRRNLLVARTDVTISREAFRAQVQDVLFRTCRAYWELVFRIRDREVKQEALELARQQLERNRAQVKIGSLAPIETVQAEQSVAAAEVEVIQSGIALDDARDQFKHLLNIQSVSPEGWGLEVIPTDEPRSEARPVDLEAAIRTAFEQDPQLRQAKGVLESRRIDRRFTRNQRLPQLDLLGALSVNGVGGEEDTLGGTVAQLPSGEYYTAWLGLSVSMPLLNRTARGEHAQAVLREKQAEALVALREREVQLTVRQAARQLNAQAEVVSAARQARVLAERQLEAEQRKFAIGTTSNFQVLQFQRQLSDARTLELQAIVGLNIAQAAFERSRGSLPEALGVGLE